MMRMMVSVPVSGLCLYVHPLLIIGSTGSEYNVVIERSGQRSLGFLSDSSLNYRSLLDEPRRTDVDDRAGMTWTTVGGARTT